MQHADEKKHTKHFDVIEPDTKRVKEKREKRKEQERLQKQLLQKQNQKLQEQKRQKQKLNKQNQEQKANYQRIKLEQIRLHQEEKNISSRLTGKFGHMINDLKTNTSNLQFTISGLELRPAQLKVLVSNIQSNASLKCLSMPRKALSDAQGKDIAQKLYLNKVLQRLQLQGNFFGPNTLQGIGKLLLQNKTIRSIDLQGNPLLIQDPEKHKQKNLKGIISLVKALYGTAQHDKNETLLYLNLNNCGLNKQCSQKLKYVFKENTTLILMDIQNNPDMGMQDVLQIQKCLKKNKQKYEDQRYKEFIERKRMKREQDISAVIMLNQQTKKLRQQAIEMNTVTKKNQLKQQWDDFVKIQQVARQKLIAKLQKQSKKKKRRRRR